MPGKITQFEGVHAFLSNFWTSSVVLDDQTYMTVEHAYQAAKFDSVLIRSMIRRQPSGGMAKREARRHTIDKAAWDAKKIVVMRGLLHQKFAIPALREGLLRTGLTTLVEGNTWNDTFWGVCNDVGENHLGLLLMAIRQEVRRTATILVHQRTYRRFIEPDELVKDGTVRCVMCGQIDETKYHEVRYCYAG